ncbi:hypothetical protein RI367_006242 [Sorochytrium milnesiophthora]
MATPELCRACNQRVYVNDRFQNNDDIFHKACFKCEHCKTTLKIGAFAKNGNSYFCKVHYMQLFKSKGNYDEGFGKEQHKTKWLQAENSGSNSTMNSGTGSSVADSPAEPTGGQPTITIGADNLSPVEQAGMATSPSNLSVNSTASRPSSASSTTSRANACQVCNKTAYPMESIKIDNHLLHTACFKCETCKTTLKLGAFGQSDNRFFCRGHTPV